MPQLESLAIDYLIDVKKVFYRIEEEINMGLLLPQ